ncbi:GGDEF domain-containing protein [Mariniblastus fucicola]|uniref:diguanylate cyclase n=1 Tax=Mariniblastus fucicola TaxID=980251 RepID=A0A5B9P854_9BACT|nr:GGDEF domain-containing protein [Mariniblastus fucicola]QEG22514.1 Diguanylate cyclase DosC [Mariniblastus fucicola]
MSRRLSQQLNRIESEALRLAPCAIIACDDENRIQLANLKAIELLCPDPAVQRDLSGVAASSIFPGVDFKADGPRGEKILLSAVQDRPSLEIQLVKYQLDGCRWTFVYFDRPENRRKRELILEKEASTDPLSGLANRRAFQRAMEANQHRALSLAIIDIDHFKLANDSHGHLAGDELIRLTSRLLRDSFSDALLVSRMGGDEFSVLFETGNKNEIIEALSAFREKVSLSKLTDLDGVQFTVSIGAVIAKVAGIESRTLLTHADQQLYLAKGRGRNQVSHVLLNDS